MSLNKLTTNYIEQRLWEPRYLFSWSTKRRRVEFQVLRCDKRTQSGYVYVSVMTELGELKGDEVKGAAETGQYGDS
jgi:hypothetical protein